MFVERGVTYVTVIAKAAFAMIHEALAVPVPPRPLVVEDESERTGEGAFGSSETAPFVPGVDVLVHGFARARRNAGTRHCAARLVVVDTSVAGEPRTLLDKTVHAYGARASHDAYPESFLVAALSSDHAEEAPPKGPTTRPTLVLPKGTDGYACFGPIAAQGPLRAGLLEGARVAFDGAHVDLSDDFPFEYFHAAPPDQRIARVDGGRDG